MLSEAIPCAHDPLSALSAPHLGTDDIERSDAFPS